MRIEGYCGTMVLCVLAAVASVRGAGQAIGSAGPKPAATLRAGPVYTSIHQDNAPAVPAEPRYPTFDVVVPLEPRFAGSALDPGGWQATEPGRSDALTANAVRRFEQTGYGLSVILALDVSGSMRGRTMNTIRASVAKFVKDAQPQDRIAVMTFADEVRWDVPFTAHPAEVRTAIDGLAARGHETHLYDAMLAAVTKFDDSMPKRRVVIVMSDGHDEGSPHTLKQVIDEANRRNISIHTIGITHSDPRYLTFLQSVSRETGGNYSVARTDKEMDDLLSNGIAALKQTPVVTFTTARSDAPPQTVPVTIIWKPQQIVAEADLTTAEIPKTTDTSNRRKLLAALCLAAGSLLILFIIKSRKKHVVPPAFSSSVLPSPQVPLPVPPEPVRVSSVSRAAMPASSVPFVQSPPWPVSPPVAAPQVSRRQTRLAVPFAPAVEQPVAFLKTLNGPAAGSLVGIDKDSFTIGAAPDNALSIDDDPTLSGHHARLSLESSMLMLDDLNSTNGTYINGVAVSGDRRSVSPGDEIRVGRTRFLIMHP